MNGDDLGTTLPRTKVTDHRRAFADLGHASAFERRDMQESVGRAIDRRHEAEALRRIEPLHRGRDIALIHGGTVELRTRAHSRRRLETTTTPEIPEIVASTAATPAIFRPITLPRH